VDLGILPQSLASMHLNLEIKTLIDFFYNEIHSKSLSSPITFKVNKLGVLKLASSLGMNIPKYIVTTSKRTVSTFFSNKINLYAKTEKLEQLLKIQAKNRSNFSFHFAHSGISFV